MHKTCSFRFVVPFPLLLILIITQTLGQIWLGMEDRSIENDWQWADGSESTYRNWASGEPNNKSGDQDCAQFLLNPGWSYVTFSSWDDINCGNKYVFMCKMPSR